MRSTMKSALLDSVLEIEFKGCNRRKARIRNIIRYRVVGSVIPIVIGTVRVLIHHQSFLILKLKVIFSVSKYQ